MSTSHLRTATLAELCEIRVGRTPSRSEPRYWGGTHPWLVIGDMTQGRELRTTRDSITDAAIDECGCRLVPPGTLLLSFKLSIGKVGITSRPLFTNEAIAALVIRNPREVDTGYLYHTLRAIDFGSAGQRAAKGMTMNQAGVASIKVPVPALAQQKRIAATLDLVAGITSKLRERIDLLDQLVQSAFARLFGDPVRNEMDWPLESLESLVDPARPITYGILMPGPHLDGGTPYVRVLEMAGDTIDVARLRRTTSTIAEAYKRSKLAAGDVLLSIRGHVGRVAMVPAALEGGNITQDSARLAPSGKVVAEYLMHCLRSPSLRWLMSRYVKGAAVKGINLKDVKAMRIPVPPIAQQLRFAHIAAHCLDVVRNAATTEREHRVLIKSIESRMLGALDAPRSWASSSFNFPGT